MSQRLDAPWGPAELGDYEQSAPEAYSSIRHEDLMVAAGSQRECISLPPGTHAAIAYCWEIPSQPILLRAADVLIARSRCMWMIIMVNTALARVATQSLSSF